MTSNSVERNLLLGEQQSPREQRVPLLERFYTPKMCVVMFTFVNLFTYLDRGAISATLTHIRSDSTISGGSGVISETKAGLIVSVFMVGYMLACPVFASLGKWISVRVIVSVGLTIWAAACVATGLSQSYGMLIAIRMLVGVGEASFSGYFVTIIDNIAPKAQRTMWIGIYYSMIPTGTALGMAAAGIISSMEFKGIAGWRLMFFLEVIVAAPVCILGCMYPAKFAPTSVGAVANNSANDEANPINNVDETSSLRINNDIDAQSLATTHGRVETPSGSKSSSAIGATAPQDETNNNNNNNNSEEPVDKAYADPITAVKHLLCNFDYLMICFGYGMYVFVTGALSVWAISMLTNGPWHMTDVGASTTIGGIVAVTGLAGSVCGGLFVDKMGGSRGPMGIFKCLLFNSTSMAIALPFGIVAMFVYNVPGFIFLFICGVFFVFTITAPVNASILSSVRHDVRTYAMSFSTLFIHLIGDFPSPTVAGAIADSFDRGCSELDDQWLCGNATATLDCYWVAATKNSNGHCVNEFETRNALVIVFSFIGLAIPLWMVAAVRARSRAIREAEEEGANQREKDN